MARRVLSTVVAVAMLVCSVGCSIIRPHTVPKDEYIIGGYVKILEVVLTGGDKIEFDSGGGIYSVGEGVIRGTLENGVDTEIDIDDVASMQIGSAQGETRFGSHIALIAGLGVAALYVAAIHVVWFSN